MKRFATISAILAAVLIAAVTLRAWAQEPAAQGFVERMLQNMLASEGRTVVVNNVSIGLTGNVTVAHVEVKDGEESWLVLDNLRLGWRPLSLFRQSLEIDSLNIDSVELRRIPVSPDSGVSAPTEMRDLSATRINRLQIGKFTIAAAVAGEETVVSIDGSGEIKQTPPEIRLDFTADRVDAKQGRLKASIVLDPSTRKLTVDVALNEQSDGLVSNLLSLRGDPAVDLGVKASGTFDNWSGDFTLDLDKERTIAGKAGMTRETSGTRLDVDGTGEVGPLLPASFAPLLRGQSQLVASVAFPAEGGRADIQRIRIDSDTLQLNASGPLDWTGTGSNLAVELRAKDSQTPITLPDMGWLGSVGVTDVRADLGITGALLSPRWTLAMAAEALTSPRGNIDKIDLRLTGVPGTGTLALDGDINGVVAAGSDNVVPPALLGPLTGRFSLVWNETKITLHQTDVTAGKLMLGVSGELDQATGAFSFNTAAQTHSPETGYALVDRLLQGDAVLAGHVIGDGKGGIELESFSIKTDALETLVSGRVDNTAVDLSLAATLSNLNLLHAGMTGKIQANATIKGPRASPEAVVDATGESVTLLSQRFEQPKFHTRFLLNADKPAGDLEFSGNLAGKPVRIATKLETSDDGTKVLRELVAQSGSARASGEFSLPPSGIPAGTLVFTAPDLREVAPLLLTRLSGSLNGSLDLRDDSGRSRLAITLNGKDIDSPSFFAQTLDGGFVIEDLLGQPRPQGEFKATRARVAGLTFATADVSARTTGDRAYSVTLRTTGNDLSVDGEAAVTIDGNTMLASVSRFSGRTRGIAFQAQPFRVHKNGDQVRVERAVLTIGRGQARLDGRISPDFDAELGLTNLPLSAFEHLASVRSLSGTVSGRVKLAGTPSAMNGEFNVTGTTVTFAQLQEQGLRPLSFDASGRMAGSRITLRGNAKSQSDLSAALDGEVDIGSPGRLDIRIRGRTGSRTFADRLAREGIRLEGAADFDLRLTGRLDDPSINGTVTLSKTTFGDTSGRFILRNGRGRLAIADNVLRIVSLEGTTGRNGRATFSGTLALDGGRAVNLKARVQDGTYNDGTLVNTIYDADLALSGSLAATPLLSGTISLKKPKITLSEIPPSALAPLDVRHKHAPRKVREQVAALRERQAGGGGGDIALDVRLRALDPISVSGRGLNVVMGGELRIAGTLGAPLATGAFTLQRGSLQLLARRLEFQRGRLDFYSDLDPKISLEAVSRRTDATITLSISGRISAPEIAVTSNPQMPQEEALARLMFDRSMTQLSPFQIAQIASFIATLSGGGGGGLLSRLQTGLGVDWLEVTETETGETAIGVGKRINERLSVGVEQSTRTNTSRVIIDLNITDNLKARGGLGSDGSSRAGFFYEKDY